MKHTCPPLLLRSWVFLKLPTILKHCKDRNNSVTTRYQIDVQTLFNDQLTNIQLTTTHYIYGTHATTRPPEYSLKFLHRSESTTPKPKMNQERSQKARASNTFVRPYAADPLERVTLTAVCNTNHIRPASVCNTIGRCLVP